MAAVSDRDAALQPSGSLRDLIADSTRVTFLPRG